MNCRRNTIELLIGLNKAFTTRLWLISFGLILNSCNPNGNNKTQSSDNGQRITTSRFQAAADCLDRYHQAAAKADFETYFGLMTNSAVFVGTDPAEHWTKSEFMAYAKPHFDKGKAWTMRAVDRTMHFTPDSSLAWFEELLDTRMKLCRGSGVLRREGQHWLVEQYVLSPTVPNDRMGEVIAIKSHHDDSVLAQLRNRDSLTHPPRP